jgi:tetratricopeptide (TPR) repeat protein
MNAPRAVAGPGLVLQPAEDLLQRQPDLSRMAKELALRYAHRELVTDQQLQALGARLWQALDAADQLEQARARAGMQVLPLAIECTQPQLMQWPWEILHHPELGFIGRGAAFALSRRLRPASAERAMTLEPGPLRVLLFTSLPDDLDAERGRLDTEAEQDAVQEALAPWIAKGLVELQMPNDGRFATLVESVREFQPQLLFLSGHGRFVRPPGDDQPGHGEFLFEGAHGESEPVRDRELVDAFIGARLQCLVLAACESGKAASDALNSGLAHQLSLRGLPHVIGMRESILDRAGIRFARAFCDALARRERVDVALQAARAAMTKPLSGAIWQHAADASLAELSLGQWCLPMLLSADPGRALIDWAFSPQPPPRPMNLFLDKVSLPGRFLGRRKELRALERQLLSGQRRQLLITGPGGQGKTALAGKLALSFQATGREVLAWSARPENAWQEFQLDLELALSVDNQQQYQRLLAQGRDQATQAAWLLRLLLSQHPEGLVLLLDNLESLQQPDSLALTQDAMGATLSAWIDAAQRLLPQGLVLLLTSRWRLPTWPKQDHWPLEHANYGDFVRYASQHLPAAFFQRRDRLRQAYRVLHGNWRGLEFFAAALRDLDSQAEQAFLQRLAQAETEVQTDMALQTVIGHRSDAEQALLHRLPAYRTPVPLEGIIKLALDLPQPERLLDTLMAVSLVEQREAPDLLTREYQCSPLVADWLRRNQAPAPSAEQRNAAADYQVYLYRHQRTTLIQAINAHEALQLADQRVEADGWALAHIVGPMNRAGLYASLLDDWLPTIRESSDPAVRADALNQTGKQLHHRGDYETALGYLKQALAIQKEIGDRAGEGTTLNNLSQIYDARGDYETALGYLKQALAIAQEIGDRAGEGGTLNNLATVSYANGDYETALGYLKQALAIVQEIGERAGEGATLNNLSQIYRARGDYETALGYLKQALAIQKEIGDRAGEGATLNNLSQIYDARGDYETALGYLKQALAIQKEIGDRAGEGTTLNNLSLIYQARGDYETALGYLKQALAIQKEIGDSAGLCITLFNIGHIHWQHEEQQQALDVWVRVYRLARPMNLAQALAALEGLAGWLGLDGGLDAWEALANRMDGD